jgi:hypothetical protein
VTRFWVAFRMIPLPALRIYGKSDSIRGTMGDPSMVAQEDLDLRGMEVRAARMTTSNTYMLQMHADFPKAPR